MFADRARRIIVLVLVMILAFQLPVGNTGANPKTPHATVKWNHVGPSNFNDAFMVEGNTGFLVDGYDGNNNYGAWLYNSNNGTLEWTVHSAWATRFIPEDLDGNGQVDLLAINYVGNWHPTELSLYRNRATTSYANISWEGYASYLGAKDMNGDGYKDLLFMYNDTGEIQFPPVNYTLQAWNGKDLSLMWSFDLNTRFKSNESEIELDKWTDLNGDGSWDLVITYFTYNFQPFKMGGMGAVVLNGKDGTTLQELYASDNYTSIIMHDNTDNNDLSATSIWLSSDVYFNLTVERIVTYDQAGNAVSNISLPNVTFGTYTLMVGPGGKSELTFVRIRPTGPGGQYTIEGLSVPDMTVKWNASFTSKKWYPHIFYSSDWNHDGRDEIIVVGDRTWVFNGNGSGLVQSFPVPQDADNVMDLDGDLATFNFNCGHGYEPNFLWVFSIKTGEMIMNFSQEEMAHDSYLADVDHDGNPELLIATENRNVSSKRTARVAVYDMDPVGSGPNNPGSPGWPSAGPGQKTPTRTMSWAESPFSLLLLAILITGVSTVLVYNAVKDRKPRREEINERIISAGPSPRTSGRSAPGVLRRSPPGS